MRHLRLHPAPPSGSTGTDSRAEAGLVPISDLRGDRLSSLPFSDRAEPLTDDQGDLKALVDGIITPLPR